MTDSYVRHDWFICDMTWLIRKMFVKNCKDIRGLGTCLQYVASVLQCVAMCVAVYCGVLYCVALAACAALCSVCCSGSCQEYVAPNAVTELAVPSPIML